MAQERAWRPADYWPQAVYLPPPTREYWEFAAPAARGSAERARIRREPSRDRQRSDRALTVTAWNIVAWVLACGVVAGIVAAIVAVFVLHLA